MLYSKSCEYAFRALTNLALQPEGEMTMVKHIAEEEEIPLYFLAKLMQDLAKRGVVRSFKGPSGGFALNMPPSEISLYHVMELLDHANLEERCAVGLYACNDETACPIHESWKVLRKDILRYLHQTTIADLAAALVEKKKKLGPAARSKPAFRRRSRRKTASA
jgi:Rrf2 family protein